MRPALFPFIERTRANSVARREKCGVTMLGSRWSRRLVAVSVAAIMIATACARPGVSEAPPRQAAVPPRAPETWKESELRELLLDDESGLLAPIDPETAQRGFNTVERLGAAHDSHSLETLFAVLLGSQSSLRLQRAALFALVRRAPASLAMARELLLRDIPDLSRFVPSHPEVTQAERRLYQRALAAAVLGASGLVEAREPLREALNRAENDAERLLFVLALTRLHRQGDPDDCLREALEGGVAETQPGGAASWGLVQLLPYAETDLLPCSLEIARLGAPVLGSELLAYAALDIADADLTPLLIEHAEKVRASNETASNNLLRSAAMLAATPSQMALVQQAAQRMTPEYAEFVDLVPAFERCRDDLTCHWKVLDEPNVEMFQYKSASVVAARAAPDQAPALLEQMERMSQPFWLADALDLRVGAPSREMLGRVRKLVPRGPEGAELYVVQGQCSRLNSPLEELAIRLDARAKHDLHRTSGE
jgi:hypothetical protein